MTIQMTPLEAYQKICSRHDRLLDVFCRTDQQCICYLCTMDDHKGHDTVSAAAERTEKQRQVGMSHQEVQQRVLEREKEVREIQEAVESLKCSAKLAVVHSEKTFTEMIGSIWRRCTEVKELIRAHEKLHVSRLEEHLKQSKKEIVELKRTESELQKLYRTEDHIHFLQYFGDVSRTVSELTKKFEHFIKVQWALISATVKDIDVLLPPDPKTRQQFLQYFSQLTLDPNTAHTQLSLSDENRKAMFTFQSHCYPHQADRFSYWLQVLCREGLTGRCYWEVEWSGSYVGVAVSYADIRRRGSSYDCTFGCNDISWRLECSNSKYWFKHNNQQTEVPGPQSSRVGVYLDHKAGTLSFYSVSSDIMTLLHRVQTMFTQPLYPGFYVWYGSAELCQLEVPYS
ncbi:tripartite motif-containing protein 16-like isoform X2 [Esox lucius]|uniref:tripartite motif-containing protein 16-like isoform X2 n=1 Tax=Esox lucius TaxID=8010 RepID=UPI000577BAF4|nr:tripartite motif-containing protein 16-like isoform X2 [Esox lucius]